MATKMMALPYIIVTILFVIAVSASVIRFGFSMIYDYSIGLKVIEIVLLKLLHIPLISYQSIQSVYEDQLSLDERFNPFRTLRLGNRFMRRFVVVRKRSGLLQWILLTPRDPDLLLRELRSHINT